MIIKKNLVKYTNCRVDNDKLKVQSKQLLEEGSDDISNLRHSKKLTRNFAHRISQQNSMINEKQIVQSKGKVCRR